jgi:hypothetical protein
MENKYYQIELFKDGITRKGFGKISDCKQYMTLIFHDHKNKWHMSKEVISEQLFKNAKPIEKEVFHTIVNQNLSNL